MTYMNQQIVLAKRPVGAPNLDDFKLIETPVPELKEGEALLRTKYFSLDPYARLRMNENSYGYSNLGEVPQGGSVCVVEVSKSPNLKVGDLVLAFTGWQKYAITNGKVMGKGMSWGPETDSVKMISSDVNPSFYLGALGMTGYTAYHGLFDIGQAKKGETVVVGAATGAVGSMVGQLAKAKGCRVVGIAGGPKKCRYAVEELGFDACVDHKSKNLAAELKEACPKGIDVYFENIGGRVFWIVLPLLNELGRVPICGTVSWYNHASMLEQPGFNPRLLMAKLSAIFHLFIHLDKSPLIFFLSIAKQLKFQGFNVLGVNLGYDAFLKETIPLIESGKIKVKEDIVKGIENAPQSFIGLLEGKNLGKLLIEV